ncbi:flagellar protein FlaG [Alkalispirillum mobile]|uniref:Flagellar protein FlaG n=1 Tax=Alkalispirillum mobile TaxID=85925 RepID=A0A498CFG2_9GAMM|nr:flagellar protein FlaG [Alkalispirillum mobile]RLK51021.1 flagellar protein FlaG [Alkalispirillum mobile]
MDTNNTVTTSNVEGMRPAVTGSQGAPAGEGVRQSEAASRPPQPDSARPVDPTLDAARPEQARAAGDPTGESVSDAVDRINEFVQVVQRDLEFSIDEDTGRTVVKVFDSKNEELIRQFPPEEILAIAEQLEELRGLLVREQA